MTINVSQKKQEYQKFESIWKKCRDVVDGQESIHENTTLYLKKLSGQTESEYLNYLDRTLFYNATGRTVDALTGLLFRKAPILKIPSKMQSFMEDIDLNGNSLNKLCELISSEILTVGGFGVLVEHPTIVNNDDNSEITQYDAEIKNLRPFIAGYTLENILNWNIGVKNNQKFLQLVVLKEKIEKQLNEFSTDYVNLYRVLDIDSETGYYRQRLFTENPDDKNSFILEDTIYPVKDNKPMTEIPFFTIRVNGLNYETTKPPILDLVNVNLSHYKTTADIEHAAHFTALPTAYVTGHTLNENETLKIGSSTAWVFSEEDAKVGFLEYTGQGIQALEKRLESKELQMSTLGARLLDKDMKSAESYETHLIKRQGEYSALSTISNSIEKGINKALKIMCEWSNISGEIEFKLNKDFVPSRLNSQDLLALFQLYQGGALSFEEFVNNLKQGEIISGNKSFEEIRNDIDNQGPVGATFGAQNQNPNTPNNN